MTSRTIADLTHPDPLGRAHRADAGALGGHVFDICIVGSGASGSVAADALVAAGHDVLVIEEGPRLTPTAGNIALDRVTPDALAREPDGAWGTRGWAWTTRNLGGGTMFYGGASFRYRPVDFDATGRVEADGLQLRWPIELTELEPYYAEIEGRLAIAAPPVDGAGDPPATLSLPGDHLWHGARMLGHAPIPTPLAIDRRLCDACSLCVCVQCTRGARRDALTAFLKPIADDARLTLCTGVRAVAFAARDRRRIDALDAIDLADGRRRRFRARRFLVGGNAIQTAALLLRSASDLHPHGLGNDRDLVGRGLCLKLSEYSHGRIARPADEVARHPRGYRGPFSTVSVLDHYLDDRCPGGIGGLIYESKFDDWRSLAGPGVVARVETILADRPVAANRVALSSRRDAWGMPKIVIDYRTDPRDAARLEYMVERSADWLRAAGATDIRREASDYALGSSHLHGTARAGDDPATSVVNRDGRIHGIDNVHVIDGAYMPYPGGLNPTLTIQANALRIARAIAGGTAR